ncbi:SURF1 family cytochrome oxidase biogenesis protein [Pseudokineococcus marinus]|uniref:SURF1-like protein n=1 Tax=Pseudokineococcus marinus TaxID=351215 RepID=A0A849BQ93_9ACTN|nr:SURF1 family cytochrome oxidase biogenesis protein [Pseudokineococcus marinus]NNH23655.1 SURF1 family protein [Pseudokineococcus marinus]
MRPTETRGPAGVVRTALRPRMLALLALALGLAVVFAELGSWQLGRARTGQQAPPERAVVPLQQVLAPQEALSAESVAGPVAVRGTWADVPQQLVVGRAADGSPGDGAWVLAAVEVPDADPAGLDPADLDPAAGDPAAGHPVAAPGDGGALLPVVLGWVPDADAAAGAPPAPTGAADLVGELAVSEDPRGLVGLPAGRLAAASSADLLNVWDGRVYAGYLVPDAPSQEALALSSRAPGARAVPPPERESGTNLQNVSYAFQWWVFAAFAVLMWLRVVHDVHRRALERAEDEAEERAAAQEPRATGGAADPERSDDPGGPADDRPAHDHPAHDHPAHDRPADDRPADRDPADRRAQEASR